MKPDDPPPGRIDPGTVDHSDRRATWHLQRAPGYRQTLCGRLTDRCDRTPLSLLVYRLMAPAHPRPTVCAMCARIEEVDPSWPWMAQILGIGVLPAHQRNGVQK